MAITSEKLMAGCFAIVRLLTILEQQKIPLSIEDFNRLSEKQLFIKTMTNRYTDLIPDFGFCDTRSTNCDKDLLEFIEAALDSQNGVNDSYKMYGIVDSAYLLAINLLCEIASYQPPYD